MVSFFVICFIWGVWCFVSVHHIHTYYPLRPEEHIRSRGTGVSDSCKWPRKCWKSNPGSLEEQVVLITVEPALQPCTSLFVYNVGITPTALLMRSRCSISKPSLSLPILGFWKSHIPLYDLWVPLYKLYFRGLMIDKTTHVFLLMLISEGMGCGKRKYSSESSTESEKPDQLTHFSHSRVQALPSSVQYTSTVFSSGVSKLVNRLRFPRSIVEVQLINKNYMFSMCTVWFGKNTCWALAVRGANLSPASHSLCKCVCTENIYNPSHSLTMCTVTVLGILRISSSALC